MTKNTGKVIKLPVSGPLHPTSKTENTGKKTETENNL